MNDFEFHIINELKIGNMVQYNLNPYSIYDMDEKLVYLSNVDLKNIGIPFSELKPILITDQVMDACEFKIESEPETIFIGDKLIEVKTKYKLKENDLKIDFKICIVMDYTEDDPFLIKTFDKIDKDEKKIKYLHQVQNIFKHYYDFELIKME